MKRNVIGVSGAHILLLMWGFGVAAIIALLLAADVFGAWHVPAEPEIKTADVQQVCFPYWVPDTPLRIECLAAYDGPFVEDGYDREVTEIMAAMVYNCSDREIGEASVTLRRGETQLQFYAQCIPAGAKVLVLEKNAAPYEQGEYHSCTGSVKDVTGQILLPQELQIDEISMGTLRVTNLTDVPLEGIVLHYKTRSPDCAFYIGGITYQAQLPCLQPEQSILITPYHYAAGYSAVVKATKTD